MSTGLCRACLVFFNDTATTEIYTLSLHDALPILQQGIARFCRDREDIIRAFPDHELILSLGCESAVNVPVRWDGRTLGALKDRKSTRLNSSHANISYAVFCLKKNESFAYLHFANC